MPLTPDQKRIFDEAWDRGLRTKEEIMPLLGMGVRSPAGQVGVSAAPAMPAEPTWEEQGGLLGAVARAPVGKQAFQALGGFEKFLFTPASTMVALGVQQSIPGEQNLEKQVRLGFEEAKAEGEGIFGQIGRAFQRGGEATIAEASLPFTIQTPDWLVGEDKTIKDVDVGRLAAELPFEIIGTKGIAAAYKAVRPAGKLIQQTDKATGRRAWVQQPREKPLPWEAKQPKRKKWAETPTQQQAREARTEIGIEAEIRAGEEISGTARIERLEREGQRITSAADALDTAQAKRLIPAIRGAVVRFRRDLDNLTKSLVAGKVISPLSGTYDRAIRGLEKRIRHLQVQVNPDAPPKLTGVVRLTDRIGSRYKNSVDKATSEVNASREKLALKQRELTAIVDAQAGRVTINPGWAAGGKKSPLFPEGIPAPSTVILPGGSTLAKPVRDSIENNAKAQKRIMEELAQRERKLRRVLDDDEIIDTKGRRRKTDRYKLGQVQAELDDAQKQLKALEDGAAALLAKPYITVEGTRTGADLIGALKAAGIRSNLRKLEDLGKADAAASRPTAEAATLEAIREGRGLPIAVTEGAAERVKGQEILDKAGALRESAGKASQDAADELGIEIGHPAQRKPVGTKSTKDPREKTSIDESNTPLPEEVVGERFLQSEEAIPLEEAVNSMIKDRPPWLEKITDWSSKHLLTRPLNAALGGVSPVMVRAERAFIGLALMGAKMERAKHFARLDMVALRDRIPEIANLVIEQPFIRVITGRKKSLEQAKWDELHKYNPVHLETGKWGYSVPERGAQQVRVKNHRYEDFYANDVTEAIFAHEHFGKTAGTGESIRSFVKSDKEGGFGYTQFKSWFLDNTGKPLTYDLRKQKIDAFLDETTEVGAIKVNQFMTLYRKALDEVEEAIDPGSADLYRNNPTMIRRRVLQFASGNVAEKASSPNFRRYYRQIADGVEAGVEYDWDWLRSLEALNTLGRKQIIHREFRDFAGNPANRFGIALEGGSEGTGLAGFIAGVANDVGFDGLNDATKKLILDTKNTLKGHTDVRNAERAKLERAARRKNKLITQEEIIALWDRGEKSPDKVWRDKVKKLGQKLFTDIDMGRAGPFEFPSTQFWMKGQDKIKLKALHRAYGLGDANAARLGLDKMLVPESQLDGIEAGLKTLNEISGKPGFTMIPSPMWSTRQFAKLADLWRLTSTGFDQAYPMTVGLPLLFRRPSDWFRVHRIQLEAWFDPNWFSNMLARDPAFQADVKRVFELGLPTGDPEVYRFVSRLGGNPDDYLAHLMRRQEDISGIPQKAMRWTGLKRFQRSYHSAAVATKVYWLRILEDSFTKGDGSLDNVSLKAQIQNLTGSINTTELGLSTSRRQIENFWVGLSPRLTRAIATLTFDAQRGVKNIATGNIDIQYALTQGQRGRSPRRIMEERAGLDPATGVRRALTEQEELAIGAYTKQALALGNLGTALFTTSLTFFTVAYAYGRASGKSEEEALQEALASIDPEQGKKHMAINMGGSWVGIGGFWRSLSQLNYKLVWSGIAASKGDMKPMNDWFSWDQFNNPLIATARNRGAPAVNFGGLAIERATGRDAAPFDVVDSNWDLVTSTTSEFFPFALQGIIEGESLAASAFGMAGARTSRQSLGDASITVARDKLSLEVDSTRDIAESWVKGELLYPFVQKKYQMSAVESNSPFGRWMARKEVLEAEFREKLTEEYQRGGLTDYELIQLFYEERGKINARLDELKKEVGMGEFDVNSQDPIAVALKKWRDVYQKEDVLTALKNERYDIIDAHRAKLFKDFTKEQQDAVLRSGGGIYYEIGILLKPESQQRYADRYKMRVAWIEENAKDSETAEELIEEFSLSMFPRLDVPRSVVTKRGRETEIRIPVGPV